MKKTIITTMLGMSMIMGVTTAVHACGDAQGCTGVSQEYTINDYTYFNGNKTYDDAAFKIQNKDLTGFKVADANILNAKGDYVSWTHNYVFNPKYTKILSAELTLSLFDFDPDPTKRGEERERKCNFSFTPAGSLESAEVILEGTKHGIVISDVDSQKYEFDVNVKAVADGTFNVTLLSTLNDFRINWSELDIVYCGEKPQAPVPEPGTFALLGAGLLGLGFFGRRRAKKQ